MMLDLSSLAIAIHAIGATVWVGGMFFAYTVLRPSLGTFEPPQRLTLWNNVFAKFFVWVWAAVIALPLSGYVLVFGYFDGFGSVGIYVHIMHMLGLVMIGLFLLLYFVPYRKYRDDVDAQDWASAAKQLNNIRRIVGVNTILGLVTIAIGASGRMWG